MGVSRIWKRCGHERRPKMLHEKARRPQEEMLRLWRKRTRVELSLIIPGHNLGHSLPGHSYPTPDSKSRKTNDVCGQASRKSVTSLFRIALSGSWLLACDCRFIILLLCLLVLGRLFASGSQDMFKEIHLPMLYDMDVRPLMYQELMFAASSPENGTFV